MWAQCDVEDWDTFAEEYFGRGDADASGHELYWQLEDLAENPMNLNTATRDDLLQLPFLPEDVADSILSRRDHAGPYGSLGELLFIRNLTPELRRYLSLFLTIGPPPSGKARLRDMLLAGRSEVESRLDIPLYRRAGVDFEPAKASRATIPSFSVSP